MAGIALLLVTLSAAITPWMPDISPASLDLSDKFLHFATFAVLTIWFSGQYSRNSYWRFALGLIAFGILIELIQGMLTYRSAEWLDIIADLAGIGFGLVIAWVGVGGWSLRFEQWLTR